MTTADQLEPVISEMLARLDENAAKVERVSTQVRQLTVALKAAPATPATQTASLELLLDKTTKLTQRQADIEQSLAGLRQEMNQRFEQLFDYLKEILK